MKRVDSGGRSRGPSHSHPLVVVCLSGLEDERPNTDPRRPSHLPGLRSLVLVGPQKEREKLHAVLVQALVTFHPAPVFYVCKCLWVCVRTS